jgi:oxygen-independent coproporphyrinogen-3 oxidase
MNGLRLDAGFTATEFTAVTGLPWSRIEPQLGDAIEKGWLSQNNGRIQTTPKGQRYLDELLQQWLPEPARHAETR